LLASLCLSRTRAQAPCYGTFCANPNTVVTLPCYDEYDCECYGPVPQCSTYQVSNRYHYTSDPCNGGPCREYKFEKELGWQRGNCAPEYGGVCGWGNYCVPQLPFAQGGDCCTIRDIGPC
jgi:hypothetical protein